MAPHDPAMGDPTAVRSDADSRQDDRTGLTRLTDAECVEMLVSTPIGRLVFIDEEGQPLALPVNFAWHDDAVVFRTLRGQKLTAALERQSVSFEVDQWDDTTKSGSSVLVKGAAAKVENWADIEILEQLGLNPWTAERWRPSWVRIEPIEISGRRIH